MRRLGGPLRAEGATAEAERIVAWLRLPAIALFALSASLVHPNPEETAFLITLAVFSAWSAAILAWVYVRPVGSWLPLVSTAVDIVAISLLAALSGGPFSHARLGFFIVPVTVAFRFRPAMTSVAALVATGAYVVQAVAHPASGSPEAARFILTQAGFLLWVGLACVLLSYLLARRTDAVSKLVVSRTRLLTDALSAEQRERKALAEALHDEALQNLLSARHEIEEANEASPHPALDRADSAVTATVGQLRSAVFDLHPYVLEEAGLDAAVRSVAQQAAARGGFELELHVRCDDRHPQEQLVFSAARELLANVVQHAGARNVTVRLADTDDALRLVVEDDGRGFPPERLAAQLADGHVGLASQRVRIEAAGGTMELDSSPQRGTRVEIALPDRASSR